MDSSSTTWQTQTSWTLALLHGRPRPQCILGLPPGRARSNATSNFSLSSCEVVNLKAFSLYHMVDLDLNVFQVYHLVELDQMQLQLLASQHVKLQISKHCRSTSYQSQIKCNSNFQIYHVKILGSHHVKFFVRSIASPNFWSTM